MAANEMITRLFHARTAAHMAHLQTNSFAQHKALNDFYDGIVDLSDDFAETYQGIFGIIQDYPDVGLPSGKPVQWIDELRLWLKKDRDASCKGETTLENIHDSIQGLCASTVYKLKYLDNPTMAGESEPDTDDYGTARRYSSMARW